MTGSEPGRITRLTLTDFRSYERASLPLSGGRCSQARAGPPGLARRRTQTLAGPSGAGLAPSCASGSRGAGDGSCMHAQLKLAQWHASAMEKDYSQDPLQRRLPWRPTECAHRVP